MTMFTRRCSHPFKRWLSEALPNAKLLFAFVLLCLLSSGLSAKDGPGKESPGKPFFNFSVDFKQGANKDAPFLLGDIHWINSILQQSNSRYAEGMSTLQRVVFLDLATVAGNNHVLRVKFEAQKASHHAYDFITGWNQALKAAHDLSGSEELMPDAQPSNSSALYDETEPRSLNVCGDAISAVAGVRCSQLHDGVSYYDLPIFGTGPNTPAGQSEGDFVIPGDVGGATVASQIAAYEAAYGVRTVRVWAPSLTGGAGSADNRVEFVKYEAGYIFYDIKWKTSVANADDAAIEFGAHISKGIGGYGTGQGASDINGGPYHVILDDLVGSTDNLGNQDNQLKGADIIVKPTCQLSGPATVCAGAGNQNYTATVDALNNPVYTWSIILSNQTTPASIVSGQGQVANPLVVSPGSVGHYTVQFVVTNDGGTGLSSTCTVTTDVICSTPSIGSPGANATIECTASPSFTAPTSSDACGGSTVSTVGPDVSSGNSCLRIVTRTWRATNSCGNSSTTVSQTITIRDTQAPTIGSAGANATIECTASPSFTAPTASDACNGSTVSTVGPDVTGGTACARTVTRTWRAVDGCGNSSATRSQTITIVDTQAPTIGQAGANATVECTAAPSFTAPTASDACGGSTVQIVGSDVTGGTTCARTVTRTWNAVDVCGNISGTRSQTITIVDTQAPSIGNAGANATIECTASPSFTAPTASDACDGATVNIVGSDVTGGTACARTITRTWNAVDVCGNVSATRSQTITIVDTQAPTIGSAGANATIECTASPSFTAPTASDACNGATVSIVGSDVTGGTACARTVTRTWRATDGCGNQSGTVAQTITIVDTQAPTIGSAGANATIECTASPSFTAPTASDACNGATVSIVGADVTGGTACARTITRTWRAVDGCGNSSATRSQTITIVDTQSPVIGPAGTSVTIECTGTPSFTAPTASDACNGATVSIVGGDVTVVTGCTRTVTRTWRATDGCGNQSGTVAQTITIVDTQAPTIGSAGANATIECTASPSFTAPTASDACDGATVNTVGADVTGGTACARTITRTWNAVDVCGNVSATRSQTITIVDTQAPTIGSAGANATIECTASPSFTAPTASDACNGATVSIVGTDVTGGTACARTVTRTWRATDGCGNQSGTVAQTITIVDTQAPTIGNAGANATIECTASPSFTAPTASDACNGATVSIVGADVTGGTACARTITRTWRAVDGCGNSSATRSQTITIVDTQAPTIGSAGANATIECTASPSFTAPTASDACNGATVSIVGADVTGGTACARTITRTWRATDGCGNQSGTVAQTITIVDTQAPTIGNAGANATIECTASPSFTAPTASDACNGATVSIVGADVTGGTACARTITRTWRAVDDCGNSSATRSQTITIVDTQAPIIGSAGANATIECTASPSFTAPTASDACNGATVSIVGTDVTGGTACARTVTRTWRATDGCGNQSGTVAQTITIVDTQAPTIGNAGANATIECTASPSFTAPTASDACNGATVSIVGADVTGGTACARTITRTWRAVDGCGNSSATRSQTITIVDTQAPTIGSAGANATIECTASPSFTAPTASDACNGATVSIVGTDVTGGTACARTVTRTWRATDGCGNQSGTVAQTITIVDTQAPTIGNAGANATIECTASPSFTAPTASDACNGATVSIVGSDVTGGTACARTITRTWRAVDGCGNSSATRSQTITIVDTQAPTIGNAGANATIECTATPSFTAPTASDACNGATVSIVGADVTGGTSCARTITRTWIAVDACGNSSATRSQTITIVDTQAPTIGNAGVNATIECTATPSFTAPTASDACDGATVSVVGADVTGGTTCARTITRTWRAVDVCGNSSATRSQTITIVDTQAPTIGNAGANATIECTATPSFTAPTASDACDGATVSIVGADVTGGTACARTITRTWRAVDNCGNNSATRSQTITIVDTQAPTIGNAGANATIECLATLVFTAPTASDACNGATVSIVGSDVTTAGANGTTLITRTWRAVDACGNSSVTRSQTITRLACIFCSYTQGFWGNKNGLAYMRDSGILATQIIIGSTAPGGKSILIPAGSWVKLNSVMPGGGPAGPLTVAGQCSILNSCFDAYLTKQGRINNVLLSQTIALSLNVRTTGGALNNLPIQSGCLQTSEDTFRLNENVVNYLTCNGATATVANLLALANNLLGGTLVPGQNVGGCVVPTYAEVNDAVTAINEGFDECRTFLGYGPCVAPLTTARTVASENSGDVTVSTSPNPYNDKIRFQIESRVSGQGTLEVYNMLGQKIQTVYQGFVQAGKGQIVYYYVPVLQRANLIYVFRVGNHRVTGKVLNIR